MAECPHAGHRGPVTRDCPPECLLGVLSRKAWNPLMRGDVDIVSNPPRRIVVIAPPQTVGDVLDLYAHGRLEEIPGLGRRRTGEIEAALVLAGFDLGALRCRQQARRNGRRGTSPHGAGGTR